MSQQSGYTGFPWPHGVHMNNPTFNINVNFNFSSFNFNATPQARASESHVYRGTTEVAVLETVVDTAPETVVDTAPETVAESYVLESTTFVAAPGHNDSPNEELINSDLKSQMSSTKRAVTDVDVDITENPPKRPKLSIHFRTPSDDRTQNEHDKRDKRERREARKELKRKRSQGQIREDLEASQESNDDTNSPDMVVASEMDVSDAVEEQPQSIDCDDEENMSVPPALSPEYQVTPVVPTAELNSTEPETAASQKRRPQLKSRKDATPKAPSTLLSRAEAISKARNAYPVGIRLIEPNVMTDGSVLAGYLGFNSTDEPSPIFEALNPLFQSMMREREVNYGIPEVKGKIPVRTDPIFNTLMDEESDKATDISKINRISKVSDFHRHHPAFNKWYKRSTKLVRALYAGMLILALRYLNIEGNWLESAYIQTPNAELSPKYRGTDLETWHRLYCIWKFWSGTIRNRKNALPCQLSASVRYLSPEEYKFDKEAYRAALKSYSTTFTRETRRGTNKMT